MARGADFKTDPDLDSATPTGGTFHNLIKIFWIFDFSFPYLIVLSKTVNAIAVWQV
jgi:hypothetical protein